MTAVQAEPPFERGLRLPAGRRLMAGLRPSPMMRQGRRPPSVSTRPVAAVELLGKLSFNVKLTGLRGFSRRSG